MNALGNSHLFLTCSGGGGGVILVFSSTTCLTVVFSCGMAPAPYFRRRTVRDHSLLFFTFVLYYIYFILPLLLFQEYGKPVYSYSTNPDRRFSSSKSQHFKMSPPFASSEGVSASGDRLQSDGVQDTHLLPHILYPLAYARGCVILRSHILILLLLILLIFHHIHS